MTRSVADFLFEEVLKEAVNNLMTEQVIFYLRFELFFQKNTSEIVENREEKGSSSSDEDENRKEKGSSSSDEESTQNSAKPVILIKKIYVI